MSVQHTVKYVSGFVLAFLSGCSNQYTTNELVGRYILSDERGTDTIELRANGQYSHSYPSKRGNGGKEKGTWHIEELQAGATAVLNDFHDLKANNSVERGAYNFLLIESWFGTMYLITNIDLNEGYKRQQ